MAHGAHAEVLCGGCFTKIDLGKAFTPAPMRRHGNRLVYFCTFGCEGEWLKKRQVQEQLFPQDPVEQIPLSFT